MFGPARSGLLGLLIIIAIVYFTGAGSWALKNIKGLDAQCYSALSRIGGQIANPVCGGLAKGIAAIDDAATSAGNRIDSWKQNLFGSNGIEKLKRLQASLGDGISGLASSGDALSQMLNAGPGSLASSAREPFQKAIDAFAIGHNYMQSDASVERALPWLQQGAQQPQGFGVMSQLTLGSLYANGAKGIDANPARAQYYLEQAKQSIGMLSVSNTSQAQKLLSSLPGSPQKIQADIDRALFQMKGQKL